MRKKSFLVGVLSCILAFSTLAFGCEDNKKNATANDIVILYTFDSSNYYFIEKNKKRVWKTGAKNAPVFAVRLKDCVVLIMI